MKTKLLFILICSNATVFAQVFITSDGLPRDTSFTIYSTYEKEKKAFPYISIVNSDSIEDVNVDSSIIYSDTYGRDLRLDVYSAENNNVKSPLVVLVHGGGWRSGDRHQNSALAKVLARNGFRAATIEYRLSPEVKYPAAIYDIKTAIRFLKNHSEKLNIDTNKIAILGCSSGGHLASFVGATNNLIRFEGEGKYSENSSDVHAIINIDGILDFTHPGESAKDTDVEKPSVGKLWLGYSYLGNPEIWIEASPLTYINQDTPPILFINSDIERFHAGRDEAIRILNKHNIYSEIHTIKNSPHTFWLFYPWFDEVSKIIISFLETVFKK